MYVTIKGVEFKVFNSVRMTYFIFVIILKFIVFIYLFHIFNCALVVR